MTTATSALLESMLVTSNRLIRIAAQATGSTTPSAVWRTLGILSTDGALRVGDLAKASRVSQPTMTKLQQNLVEEGLARRIGDDSDSRVSLIEITAAGQRGLEEWRHELTAALGPLFSDLTAEETRTLERAVAIVQARTKTISSTSTNGRKVA
ncbi:MAG: hypothetical protein JWO10_477 [Microbacteriaceae bacterium]|nr:hypothetical protein [Microbacteriaceae bacterium]